MKKYLNEGHLGLLFGIVTFVYFLFTGVTRDKITSGNDLFEVKGTYLTHSFKDNAGFKNFTHQYYIWTKEYSNAFQVKADYLRIFKGQDFITEIRRENILILSIPKHLEKKLDSPDNVFVTSIESAGRIYLNKDEVLKIEQGLAASKSDYFIGTMHLAAGMFVYFRGRFRQPKSY